MKYSFQCTCRDSRRITRTNILFIFPQSSMASTTRMARVMPKPRKNRRSSNFNWRNLFQAGKSKKSMSFLVLEMPSIGRAPMALSSRTWTSTWSTPNSSRRSQSSMLPERRNMLLQAQAPSKMPRLNLSRIGTWVSPVRSADWTAEISRDMRSSSHMNTMRSRPSSILMKSSVLT